MSLVLTVSQQPESFGNDSEAGPGAFPGVRGRSQSRRPLQCPAGSIELVKNGRAFLFLNHISSGSLTLKNLNPWYFNPWDFSISGFLF